MLFTDRQVADMTPNRASASVLRVPAPALASHGCAEDGSFW